MNYRQLSLFICFWFSSLSLLAQVADFTVPSVACIDQRIEIASSTAGENVEWDFCARDMTHEPVVSDAVSVPGFLGGFGYKLVIDNGNYFGFVPSYAGNIIFRLDFGTSLANTPTVINLGNPGNVLNKPQSIEVSKVDGVWYGFVGYDTPGHGIVKLNFGNSLTNIPTGELMGDFGFPTMAFYDLKLVTEISGKILVLLDRVGGSLVRIRFDNFIDYDPQSADIHVTSGIPEASSLFSFDIGTYQNEQIVLLSSYFNNKIIRLDYGETLLQDFVAASSYTSTLFDQPIQIKLVNEVGRNYVLVGNNSSSKGMSIIDYNDFTEPPADVLITLPSLFSVDALHVDGETILTGLGSNSVVKRLVFRNECGATPSFSHSLDPADVVFTSAGTKYLAVKASNDFGYYHYQENSISVSSLIAPPIDTDIQNNCAQHAVYFTPISTGTIVTYDWDFGDGFISVEQAPQHSYSVAGEYTVALEVLASNGCSNSIIKSATIYNEPLADFQLPTVTQLCTNQAYILTNSSLYDPESNPSWQWFQESTPITAEQNMITTFENGNDQTITLRASIPGCFSETTKTISNVQVGPAVDFSVNNGCQNDVITFTNATEGSVTSYLWSFGDGNNSTEVDPEYSYSTNGSFTVSLTANNELGCSNTISKLVQIYSQPQPNFSLALPPFSCAGSPSQFTDLTPPMTDSNIASWAWKFGDAPQGTSTLKNPTYTYAQADDYTVSLEVTTNFGCTNAIEKSVTISQPPVADFTFGPACLNQATQFTDASGTDNKTWLWTAQNNSYTTKNPTHNFSATGQQPVTLSVTANNNCVSQVTKMITVPVPVSVDFNATSTCATLPAIFNETTTGGTDPTTSWSWDFSGQAGSGSPAEHTFAQVGTYPVRLNSTRQSGCTYSTTRNITIVQPPVAQFTVPTDAGAAPFTVGFTNTSTQATQFMWRFNDGANSASTEFSPTFIFNQVGSYPVQLTASNSSGCVDDFTKMIYVVIPKLNAAITDFTLTPLSDGTFRGAVSILNKSNLAISNPEVIVSLSGLAQVKERIPVTLQPNQSVNHILASTLVAAGLQYACAQVQLVNDENEFDDEQCTSLINEALALPPYPNPVSDELILNWINSTSNALSVVIYSSSGRVVMEQLYEPVLLHLNQVKIDVSALPQGIYYAEYQSEGIRTTYRFAVVR